MKRPRNFASDNNSGICPEAWAALEEANQNHAPGYGDDRWTKQAADLIREVFETDCEVFFVFNGTAANSSHWLPPAGVITVFYVTKMPMWNRMNVVPLNFFPMELKYN